MNIGEVSILDGSTSGSPAQGRAGDEVAGGDLFQALLAQMILGQVSAQTPIAGPGRGECAQGIADLFDLPAQGIGRDGQTADLKGFLSAVGRTVQLPAGLAADFTQLLAEMAGEGETGGAGLQAQAATQPPAAGIAASTAVSETLAEMLRQTSDQRQHVDSVELARAIVAGGSPDDLASASAAGASTTTTGSKAANGNPGGSGQDQLGNGVVEGVRPHWPAARERAAATLSGDASEVARGVGGPEAGTDERKERTDRVEGEQTVLQAGGRPEGMPGHRLEAAGAPGHGVSAQRATPLAERMIEQVTNHLTRVVASGPSEVSLQLEPQWLGRLDVRVSVGEGGLTIQLTAANSDTRGLLEGSLAQLRETLSEQGFRIDRVLVGLSHGLAAFDSGARQARDDARRSPQGSAVRPIGEDEDPAAAGVRRLAEGIIDYRV